MLDQGKKYFNNTSSDGSLVERNVRKIMSEHKTNTSQLTTTAGNPVGDNQTSITAGPRDCAKH